MRRPMIKTLAAFAMVAGLGACATQDMEMKLHALEEKVNTALQTSAAAKVDATTALHMAVDLEEKIK